MTAALTRAWKARGSCLTAARRLGFALALGAGAFVASSPLLLLPGYLGYAPYASVTIGAFALGWFHYPRMAARSRRIRALCDAPNPWDTLHAVVRGAGFPELEAAALERARALYGADATLVILKIDGVRTAISKKDLFIADVYVRHIPRAGGES